VKRTAIALALGATAACSGDLPPASLVDGVRILATRADHPYAMPGETVTLQVLAVDGRSDPRATMRVFWLPTACVNPAGDAYFGCYPSMRGRFPVDTDLSTVLVEGPQWVFTMPPGAIDTANPHPGAGAPYGVAFAFLMACAGRVQYHPVDTSTSSPLTTPFRCLDGSGNPLGADDFVFAFTRVYAYATLRNANPVIDHLTVAGAPVGSVGIALDHCTAGDESHCATSEIDTVVPATSWEVDPGSLAPAGQTAHEAIWVDYYATGGRFDDDSAVLFEATTGKVAKAGVGYAPPLSAGPRTLWAIVHDTRGGASWVSVPVAVR
jgi:hypothetical protein